MQKGYMYFELKGNVIALKGGGGGVNEVADSLVWQVCTTWATLAYTWSPVPVTIFFRLGTATQAWLVWIIQKEQST